MRSRVLRCSASSKPRYSPAVLPHALDGCLGETKVLALLEGNLSAGELTQVDAHIDRCADCRVLVSSLMIEKRGESRSDATYTDAAFSPTLLAPTVDSGIGERGSQTEVAEPAALNVGETLVDRFKVLERVGKGGMGEVFRARDASSGGDVAVKVNGANGPAENARFEREAELLLRLDHPAIVRHVAHGRAHDGTPFLAMQWLDGEDLSSRLRRGRLPLADTLNIAIRIASALSAAHAVGVIHRDIKPSNIFLQRSRCEEAMLIDFGVARSPWRGAQSLSTRTGALLGTLGYMAPEQAVRAKTVDGRADIFSLGCVVFECLTAERLFAGQHAVEILAKLLSDPIRAPSEVVGDVPPALDALVSRMLSRDVARRPASCTELVMELEEIVATGGQVVRASPDGRSDSKRVGWSLATVAVLVLAGIVVAPSVTRMRAPATPAAESHVSPVETTAAPLAPPSAPTLDREAPRPSASATPSLPRPVVAARPAAPVRPPPVVRAATPAPSAREADPFGHFRN